MITWLDGSKLRTRTTAGTADLSQANSSSARTTDSFVDVSLVSSGTSLNLGGVENSFNVLGDLQGDWGPTVIGTFELIAGFANDPGAAVEVVAAAAVTAGEYSIDAGAGAIDSFVDTLNPFSPWVDIPNIGPVFGHEDAYFVGNVAGTVAGMVAASSIGNIAAGTSSLVACGSLAQKAAKLYTAIDTVAGIANATSNIAAGNASLGDALAFLPILTVGVQKLRGAPTNCFIAGTLVAVAGVNADAGPSNASKPIEEIQVGDFVWARAEHDPSAQAVLQKVVALYRKTAHDLQTLEVVGEQGQSVQIVATDEHPFYVVDVGWTTADAVQVGQKLVGAGGAVLTVVANRDWKPEGGVVVYNFQVEGDHTYFVGDIHAQGEWVWTHNACSVDAFGSNGPNGGVGANKAAGDAVRDLIAKREAPALIEQTFTTVGGVRRVDVLKLGGDLVGIESKVGRTALDSRVRQELARDWWLRRQGQLDRVVWEFSPSDVTGKSGPTRQLLQTILRLGFDVRINAA